MAAAPSASHHSNESEDESEDVPSWLENAPVPSHLLYDQPKSKYSLADKAGKKASKAARYAYDKVNPKTIRDLEARGLKVRNLDPAELKVLLDQKALTPEEYSQALAFRKGFEREARAELLEEQKIHFRAPAPVELPQAPSAGIGPQYRTYEVDLKQDDPKFHQEIFRNCGGTRARMQDDPSKLADFPVLDFSTMSVPLHDDYHLIPAQKTTEWVYKSTTNRSSTQRLVMSETDWSFSVTTTFCAGSYNQNTASQTMNASESMTHTCVEKYVSRIASYRLSKDEIGQRVQVDKRFVETVRDAFERAKKEAPHDTVEAAKNFNEKVRRDIIPKYGFYFPLKLTFGLAAYRTMEQTMTAKEANEWESKRTAISASAKGFGVKAEGGRSTSDQQQTRNSQQTGAVNMQWESIGDCRGEKLVQQKDLLRPYPQTWRAIELHDNISVLELLHFSDDPSLWKEIQELFQSYSAPLLATPQLITPRRHFVLCSYPDEKYWVSGLYKDEEKREVAEPLPLFWTSKGPGPLFYVEFNPAVKDRFWLLSFNHAPVRAGCWYHMILAFGSVESFECLLPRNGQKPNQDPNHYPSNMLFTAERAGAGESFHLKNGENGGLYVCTESNVAAEGKELRLERDPPDFFKTKFVAKWTNSYV